MPNLLKTTELSGRVADITGVAPDINAFSFYPLAAGNLKGIFVDASGQQVGASINYGFAANTPFSFAAAAGASALASNVFGFLGGFTQAVNFGLGGNEVALAADANGVPLTAGEVYGFGRVNTALYTGIGDAGNTPQGPLFVADAYVAPQTAAWTSATAVNTVLTATTNGMDGVGVTVNCSAGTLTGGQVIFEIWDGYNWANIRIAQVNSPVTNLVYNLAGLASTTQFWNADTAPFTQFRVRIASAIVGTATINVVLNTSSAPSVSLVTVQIDPNTWVGTGSQTPSPVASATSTLAKTGAGLLSSILVTTAGTGAGNVLVYDGTSASGTVIAIIPATVAVGQQYAIGAGVLNGIYVANVTNGPALTVNRI